MRILDFQGKQTNLCGHGLQIRAIAAEINLRDRVLEFYIKKDLLQMEGKLLGQEVEIGKMQLKDIIVNLKIIPKMFLK